MLILTERVAGSRCPACGRLGVHTFSIFGLNRQTLTVACECGFEKVKLSRKSRMVCAEIACVVCEETHMVLVPLTEFVTANMFTLLCPHTHCDLGYLGTSESEVVQEVRGQERMSMVLPFDETYFSAPEVMREILEILERVADSGQLTCECGNSRIDLDVFSDKVELSCPTCGGLLLVYAESSEDLFPLRNMASITLRKNGFNCIDAANYSNRRGSRNLPRD